MGGDGFPMEYREPMAGILVNHGDTVVETVSSSPSERPLDRYELFDVVSQISADATAYGLLNEGMNYALIDALDATPENPDEALHRVGETVGYLEAARREAMAGEAAGEIDAASWRSTWASYTLGSALDFLPHAGGAMSGAVDMASQAWLEAETKTIEDNLLQDSTELSQSREAQLEFFRDYWYQENEEWARGLDNPISSEETRHILMGAANDGKGTAEGDPENR